MIKAALKRLVECTGYRVYSRSLAGIALEDDLPRLLCHDRPNIIDVGANAGQTLSRIKALFPAARVWCYEPDPRSYAELLRMASAYSGVTCIQAALGAVPGPAEFHCGENSVTSSILRPSRHALQLHYRAMFAPAGSLTVDIRVLSEELNRLQIDRVHLLKTDCQGFDFQVLRGAEPHLDRGTIECLLIEVLFHSEYEGQTWFHQLLPWLVDKGYEFYGLYDTVHDPDGRALFADALFRRASPR